MKRLITAVTLAASLITFTTTAHSENFNYIVGASVDGGQAKWAQQLTKQWNKFLKVAKSDYMDNYIKYNQERLKFKRPQRKQMNKETSNENLLDENLLDESQIEQLQDNQDNDL